MEKLLPHRSSEEIAVSILQTAEKGATTRMTIMANVFITFETATAYLERLVKQGLIDHNPGTGTYMTTDRGKQMIMQKGNSDF